MIDLAPRGSLVWWFIRLLERLGLAPARPATTVEKLDEALRDKQTAQRAGPATGQAEIRVMLTDTPVYHQLHPASPLLAELSAPGAMPHEVRCDTFYGDIRYTVRISANRLRLVNRTVSFGDLVVTAASASGIPRVPCTAYPFIDEKSLVMTLTAGPAEQGSSPDAAMPGERLVSARALADYLPAVSHHLQLSHPAIQQAVLRILAP
jgi:hypothetical protein